MKASVIIPTKNPGAIFERVLDAVLNQNTPWPYEVLVIDSGSSDGTIDLVKSYPNVALHEVPPTEFGHGKTRNLAISLCSGEYIAVITHDALPADNQWLKLLVESVEQDSDIAGSFGRHLAYPHDGPFIERDLRLHFEGFLHWPKVMSLEDPQRYATDQGYRQVLHFFSDNNACIRRSAWEAIPYPEVDFAEDQLWAKTIIESGFAKAYCHEAAVYHSHTFGAVDWCRRSFDEAKALKALFGYNMCPNLGQLLKQAFKMTINDFRYFSTLRLSNSSALWLLKTCASNFTRQLGFYLGQRAEQLPETIVRAISRDIAIRNQS